VNLDSEGHSDGGKAGLEIGGKAGLEIGGKLAFKSLVELAFRPASQRFVLFRAGFSRRHMLPTRSESPRQMQHRFHVIRLGKQIHQLRLLDPIARF
jgi:hypothetical protein